MPTSQEIVKEKVGNPFLVLEAIEAAAKEGFTSLNEDDLFLAKWYGLYTHRHEPGYFMMRLKIPNGILNPQQLKTIARIAAEQNKDFADLTTREDIQLHWVSTKDVPAILEELKQVGITTLGACGDLLRNLVGCPVAGVDPTEYFDASPVLMEAHRFFVGNPEFSNLPRKYKVSIAACRDQCQQPEIHCVSFVGGQRDLNGVKEIGFDLRLGGGLSTKPYYAQRLDVFVRPPHVVPILKAITELYRDAPPYRATRSRARFKFLIADWGIEKFREVLQGKLDFPLERLGPFDDPVDSYRDHVGVHEQKQPGLFYIGIPIVIGRIRGAQMRRVADLAERYGDGSIRLTVRQNLLILNIPEENVPKVLEGLASVELKIDASPFVRGVLSCTGIEFCKLAVTETKKRAREVVEYLESRLQLEEPLRIHITGCPNNCAQASIAHIGLQGSKTKVGEEVVEAYDVAVGGQLGFKRSFNHFVLRKIPATQVKFRLENLLRSYKKLRRPGEGFNEFCARLGDDALAQLLGEESPPSKGVVG